MNSTLTREADAKLSPADRCDRCGAQAYVRATLASGGELLFCGHHGRQNKEALTKQGSYFHDETAALRDTPVGER